MKTPKMTETEVAKALGTRREDETGRGGGGETESGKAPSPYPPRGGLAALVPPREFEDLVRAGCPFCGAVEPGMICWDKSLRLGGDSFYYFRCLGCGCFGPEGPTVEEARERWERRRDGCRLAAAQQDLDLCESLLVAAGVPGLVVDEDGVPGTSVAARLGWWLRRVATAKSFEIPVTFKG